MIYYNWAALISDKNILNFLHLKLLLQAIIMIKSDVSTGSLKCESDRTPP